MEIIDPIKNNKLESPPSINHKKGPPLWEGWIDKRVSCNGKTFEARPATNPAVQKVALELFSTTASSPLIAKILKALEPDLEGVGLEIASFIIRGDMMDEVRREQSRYESELCKMYETQNFFEAFQKWSQEMTLGERDICGFEAEVMAHLFHRPIAHVDEYGAEHIFGRGETGSVIWV